MFRNSNKNPERIISEITARKFYKKSSETFSKETPEESFDEKFPDDYVNIFSEDSLEEFRKKFSKTISEEILGKNSRANAGGITREILLRISKRTLRENPVEIHGDNSNDF